MGEGALLQYESHIRRGRPGFSLAKFCLQAIGTNKMASLTSMRSMRLRNVKGLVRCRQSVKRLCSHLMELLLKAFPLHHSGLPLRQGGAIQAFAQ